MGATQACPRLDGGSVIQEKLCNIPMITVTNGMKSRVVMRKDLPIDIDSVIVEVCLNIID